MCMLPDGNIITGSNQGWLHIWDISTGKIIKSIHGHSRNIKCISVVPDGRIVSGYDDGTLKI